MLQVNFPRWVNSTAGHRGASSFQRCGQAHRLTQPRRRREGGVSFSLLVRIPPVLCDGRGGRSPWGGLVARAGDA